MRKQEHVVVPSEWGGRDAGKMFLIEEMDAARAEKWALRLYLAVKGTTAEIPPEVERLGMVGVAIRGLNAFFAAPVKFEELEPLLDEMFTCVRMVRDPNRADVATALMPSDVEEVRTRAWLRSEVLRVHTNFSFSDALWRLMTILTREDSPST